MKSLNSFYYLVLLIIVAGFNFCNAGQSDLRPSSDSLHNAGTYKLEEVFPNIKFDQPVELTSPNDNTNRVFVVAQKGLIHVLANKSAESTAPVFLDIVSKVNSGGEKGLLGLAFDPNYTSNGYFYINYTRGNPLTTVISRFKVSSTNPDLADPASEKVLLQYTQPYDNHNGGKVAFGNDGFLYIAAGDGGAGGDPGNRAQNKKELLGKIIRIDVNKTATNLAYAIPPDNPFAGNAEGFREEIYAVGMRNPWRFSFDKQTGRLWAGDVGQNKVEEVDIIERGGNYGWKIMEGEDCYGAGSCDKTGLTEPIWSYKQGSETGRSITGGYVCRDKSLPGLAGKYVYGDYVTGNVWALTFVDKKAVKNELIAKLPGGLSSFGEDNKSNLYLMALGTGKVYRLAL